MSKKDQKKELDELVEKVENDLASKEDEVVTVNENAGEVENDHSKEEFNHDDEKEVYYEPIFKVYDHTVKVNGVFYKKGEKVPI